MPKKAGIDAVSWLRSCATAHEESRVATEAVAMIDVRAMEFVRSSIGLDHLGASKSDRNGRVDQFGFTTAPFIAAQKSGLFARGTAASCPEYHMMFSAQTASAQSPRPRP